jgi:hypothetical protein
MLVNRFKFFGKISQICTKKTQIIPKTFVLASIIKKFAKRQ